MPTYNTGNTLGSADPRDLYDNSQIADEYVNSTDPLVDDRLGRTRYTWAGMEVEFEAAQIDREASFDAAQDDRRARFDNLLASSGYDFLGDYAAGIEITEYNQLLRDSEGEFWRLSGSTELPYTTTGAGLPEEGAFIPTGDAALRQELATGTATVASDTGIESISEALNKRSIAYSANAFGFDVNGTAEGNRDAIIAAVEAANGMPVKIYADQNFQCSSLIISNQDIDLEVVGKGRMDRTQGGGRALTLTYDLTDVVSVSQITRETLSLDGSTTTVWAISASDSTAYKRGDFVRVVSDDRDPNAAGAGTADRKFGEVAVVAAVGSGLIYLSTDLEDATSMTNNIRVGRYQDRKIKIKGLETEGDVDTENGQVVVLNGALRAEIDIAMWGHPWIGFQPNGCVLGIFRVRGRGKGDNSGSLGYLINESGGYKNKYIRPEGSYYRHVFTTNFSSTDFNSPNLYSYGGSRDIEVIDGEAEGCQGCPWDDHAGARRTKFIRCSARGMLNNTTTSRTVFQLRGKETVIVEPSCDDTMRALVRVASDGQGTTHTIYGGTNLPVILAEAPVPFTGQRQTLRFVGTSVNLIDSQSGLFDLSGNVSIFLEGGSYSNLQCVNNTHSLIRVNSGLVITLNSPFFRFGVSDPSSQFNRPFAFIGDSYCKLSGRAKFVLEHTDGAEYSSLFWGDNSEAIVRVKLEYSGPTIPNSTIGPFSSTRYLVSAEGATQTNVADFNDYLRTLGGL